MDGCQEMQSLGLFGHCRRPQHRNSFTFPEISKLRLDLSTASTAPGKFLLITAARSVTVIVLIALMRSIGGGAFSLQPNNTMDSLQGPFLSSRKINHRRH